MLGGIPVSVFIYICILLILKVAEAVGRIDDKMDDIIDMMNRKR